MLHLRRDPHLGANRRYPALGLGELGQFPRLRKAVTKRPFAIDVLAGIQRRRYQVTVMRHLDGHDDKIDLRRLDQRLRIFKGMRQSEGRGCLLRAGKAGVRDADHLISIRQRLQRGDVSGSGPVNTGVKADESDTDSLVSHGIVTMFLSESDESGTSATGSSLR